MGSKERRLSYSFAFKVEVVNYAGKHGNRAAERHFGSPPTEKGPNFFSVETLLQCKRMKRC
jgi:hypothetical protein